MLITSIMSDGLTDFHELLLRFFNVPMTYILCSDTYASIASPGT